MSAAISKAPRENNSVDDPKLLAEVSFRDPSQPIAWFSLVQTPGRLSISIPRSGAPRDGRRRWWRLACCRIRLRSGIRGRRSYLGSSSPWVGRFPERRGRRRFRWHGDRTRSAAARQLRRRQFGFGVQSLKRGSCRAANILLVVVNRRPLKGDRRFGSSDFAQSNGSRNTYVFVQIILENMDQGGHCTRIAQPPEVIGCVLAVVPDETLQALRLQGNFVRRRSRPARRPTGPTRPAWPMDHQTLRHHHRLRTRH